MRATSRTILDAAVEGGVPFIDTADVYPLGGGLDTVGRTEEIIGRWLADTGRRDDVVLATKCVGATGPRPWERGASRRHVLDAIDASLRRLQTDFIDLYQLHSYDAETPIDETLSALDHLVQVGKVRYVGCSNFLAYQLARAVGRSETLGLARMDSVQPRYNLLFRQIERELLPLCADEGIGIIPYNPIAGGLLSGKHGRGAEPTGRFALGRAGRMYQERYWHDREFDTIDALVPMAAKAGVSLDDAGRAVGARQPDGDECHCRSSPPSSFPTALSAAESPLDVGIKEELDQLTAVYRQGDAPRRDEEKRNRPGGFPGVSRR